MGFSRAFLETAQFLFFLVHFYITLPMQIKLIIGVLLFSADETIAQMLSLTFLRIESFRPVHLILTLLHLPIKTLKHFYQLS